MSGHGSQSHSAGSSTHIAPAPNRADIGIIAALPIETGEIMDRLKQVRKYQSQGQTVYEGEYNGRIIALIHSGMGQARATRAASHLLSGHRPFWVIHPGFCGGLDPSLKTNDVFLPSEIVNSEGQFITVPIQPQLLPPALTSGRLLTVDTILRKTQEKAAWHEQSGASIVDMESFAVASLCQQMNLRWIGLRVVTDSAQDELPPEIMTITGPTGAFRLGATIGALWSRPSAVKDLLKLRETAQLASEKLAIYTMHLVDALPIP